MKFVITIIALLTISTFSIAQTSTPSFKDITLGASAKTNEPTKTASTYQIGRFEEAGDFQLFIPKAFSPNGDGVDDIFQIESNNILTFQFMVFDQFGGFKYESNDASLNWDGEVRGKDLRSGVYVYVIKLTTLDGQIKKFSGTLMIEE